MLDIAKYNKICLDTTPFIYFIEEHPKYSSALENIFSTIDNGEIRATSSYITLLELLVKPIEFQDEELAARYKGYFYENENLDVFPIEENVAEIAAEIRAKYNGNGFKIRTPDAIHISTAIISGADVFLTNDFKLKNVEEIEVVVLDEVV